jgi:hypothetical protein
VPSTLLWQAVNRAPDATAARVRRPVCLVDWILVHEPPPEDEEGPLTDEERLEEMERADAELSMEISSRYFTGETYDDGYDITDMEMGGIRAGQPWRRNDDVRARASASDYPSTSSRQRATEAPTVG